MMITHLILIAKGDFARPLERPLLVTYPITLIAFGRSKLPAHRELMEHYQRLLRRYVRLKIHKLEESKHTGLRGLSDEAAQLRKYLKPQDYLILLSEAGPLLTSEKFAKELSAHLDRGTSLVFAVGSSNGWDEKLKQEASSILSLSPMTFPHDLARVLFCEQLYRAFSILQGMPYHK